MAYARRAAESAFMAVFSAAGNPLFGLRFQQQQSPFGLHFIQQRQPLFGAAFPAANAAFWQRFFSSNGQRFSAA